jgi:hypothetical protein
MKANRVRDLLVMAGWLALIAEPVAGVSLRVVSNTALPGENIARDIRWAGPSEVYVSLGKKGAIRTGVLAASPFITVMPPADRGGFFISGRIAAGRKHLVVASPLGGFGWIPFESRPTGKVSQKGLMTVMDIDARGDLVAVLGADSGDVQGLARDGVIAWTGSLSAGLANMRPLMKGRAKPGGKDMARCSILETGAIRFMRDGSVVVVPGVEPGIYRYDDRGKLIQTWDTGPLGMVDDCAIADTELSLLARDFARRTEWLASRITVDDVLPLRSGPALLLRRVENGVTRWDLVTLPFQGKTERITLPVSMPTPRAHVRGDVRGDRLVLLVFDDPLPGQKPAAAPQVIVLSVGGQ